VLKHFTSSYLATKDIHSLCASYSIDTRKTVLSAYYRAVAALESRGNTTIPRQPESALLKATKSGKASIFALFGGQGTNEVYFDELQSLYDIYQSYVTPFLEAVIPDLIGLAEDEVDSSYYTHGLDVISWLSGATERPSVTYLASVPLSLPLIGLTQLIQYLVVCRVTNLTPGQVRSRIAGATGHSQGILSAVVVSASETFNDFTENSRKALRWLFYCGLRGQQAFPPVAVAPSLVQDTLNGGEGTPSPMLSVAGLPLKELEGHIKKTNSHLPANSQLGISLYNGPRAFVVTGPARALHGLVTNLRKVKAPSGADQSKVAYSQRKPVFSIRFLVVAVPYHSPYLRGVTDTVMEEDLDELWEPSDLKIPVYNTETGMSINYPLRIRVVMMGFKI
jgi:fatty acid synthase subunit beta